MTACAKPLVSELTEGKHRNLIPFKLGQSGNRRADQRAPVINSGKISLLKSMRTSQLMGRLRSNGYAKKTATYLRIIASLIPKELKSASGPARERATTHVQSSRGSDITTITRRVRFIQNGRLSPSLTIVPIVHVLLDLILLITVTPCILPSTAATMRSRPISPEIPAFATATRR